MCSFIFRNHSICLGCMNVLVSTGFHSLLRVIKDSLLFFSLTKSMFRLTFSKNAWLFHHEYSVWLQSAEDKISAYCKKCRKILKLENMRETAKTPMKGSKHTANFKPVSCFFKQKAVSNCETLTDTWSCCVKLLGKNFLFFIFSKRKLPVF